MVVLAAALITQPAHIPTPTPLTLLLLVSPAANDCLSHSIRLQERQCLLHHGSIAYTGMIPELFMLTGQRPITVAQPLPVIIFTAGLRLLHMEHHWPPYLPVRLLIM